MSSLRATKRSGFTLIELLLVVGIIGILAGVVIMAINPTKMLGFARDAQRRNDVSTILNAIYQYSIDNNGNLPPSVVNVSANYTRYICKVSSTCTSTGAVNLRILTGSYLVSVPVDPRIPAAYVFTATGTYYTISRDSRNRVTVTAPGTEQTSTITVTR
jgi:prepilin-type N-terminal cleavage/methylation domain-containing protein